MSYRGYIDPDTRLRQDIDRARHAGKPLRQAERRLARKAAKQTPLEKQRAEYLGGRKVPC